MKDYKVHGKHRVCVNYYRFKNNWTCKHRTRHQERPSRGKQWIELKPCIVTVSHFLLKDSEICEKLCSCTNKGKLGLK